MSVGSAKSSSDSYYGCCDCEDAFPDEITVDFGSGWSGSGHPWYDCLDENCEPMGGEHTLTSVGCSYPGAQDGWDWVKSFVGEVPPCVPWHSATGGLGASVMCWIDGLGVLQYYFHVTLQLDYDYWWYELQVEGAIDCSGGSLILPTEEIQEGSHCLGGPSTVELTW